MKAVSPRAAAALLALVFSANSIAQMGAPLVGASGAPVGSYTATAKMAAARALGVPFVLSKSAVPFIYASSASMGDNGALTGHTAMPRTYAKAYMYLPAGAVAAGVPAAATWYYVQCSSTTACTVFNNIYTTGTPTIPATPTAFVTTGPGAFAGGTGAIVGPSISVPANAMGTNGQLRSTNAWRHNNSAGAKTPTLKFGGTQFYAANYTTTTEVTQIWLIANEGVANSQTAYGSGQGSTGGFGEPSTNNPSTGTIDTTAAQTLDHVLSKAVVTDFQILNGYLDELLADGT